MDGRRVLEGALTITEVLVLLHLAWWTYWTPYRSLGTSYVHADAEDFAHRSVCINSISRCSRPLHTAERSL